MEKIKENMAQRCAKEIGKDLIFTVTGKHYYNVVGIKSLNKGKVVFIIFKDTSRIKLTEPEIIEWKVISDEETIILGIRSNDLLEISSFQQ